MQQLVGAWDRVNTWPDHLYFNADYTGIHDMTGDLFPFTYIVTDGILYLSYDDGEEISYEVNISGDDLVLTDDFYDEELIFVRGTGSTPVIEEKEGVDAYARELIGVWVSEEDGEVYAFNQAGTGYQIYEGVTYGFTYEIDEDYVEIFYDDGDDDDFDIEIDGDTLIINGRWTYTRQ